MVQSIFLAQKHYGQTLAFGTGKDFAGCFPSRYYDLFAIYDALRLILFVKILSCGQQIINLLISPIVSIILWPRYISYRQLVLTIFYFILLFVFMFTFNFSNSFLNQAIVLDSISTIEQLLSNFLTLNSLTLLCLQIRLSSNLYNW